MNSFWVRSAAALAVFILFCGEAVLDPEGLVNFVLCSIVDVLFVSLPSTPTGYHLADILQSFFNQVSWLGVGLFVNLFQNFFALLTIVITVKMVKLIRG